MSKTAKAVTVFGFVIALLVGLTVAKLFILKPNAIRIGSKNFTEQVILGEMLAQLIEKRLNIPVERKLNLGGTFVCFNALKAGELDLYVEYTGTGLTAILKEKTISDPDEVYKLVAERFKREWNLVWQKPLGFNNTYTITMREDHAKKMGIKSISDIKAHKGDLLPGFNHEFLERPDGYPGLMKHYGFRFEKRPKEMDTGIMYRAISDGQVDVICAFATDGRIPAFNLIPLEDDKNFFPPYYASPLVRGEVLEMHPDLSALLGELSDRISDSTMAEMNYLVDVEEHRPEDIVRYFLEREGLI